MKNPLRQLLLATGATLLVSIPGARGAELVKYDFGTSDPLAPTLAPTMELSGVDGSAFSANSGTPFDTDDIPLTTSSQNSGTTSMVAITNNPGASASGVLLSRPDGHTTPNAMPPTDVDTNTNYFSFTLTANTTEVPGATLTAATLEFDYAPGGGSNRGFTVAYAINGSADFTSFGTEIGGNNNASATVATFSRLSYPITGAEGVDSIEFRFFTFASNASGRSMFFDNFTVSDAAPGPPATAQLGFAVERDGADLVFTWNSVEGMTYSLLNNPDLSTPPATWPVLQPYENLAATPPVNMVTVPFASLPAGDKRFFVLQTGE